MSSLGSPSPFFLAGKKAYEVERSLRFSYGDSANLTRTSSSASTTFTYSAWIKRARLTEYQSIFSMGVQSFTFHANYNTLILYDGSTLHQSARVFRDPSAWYHIVVQINSGVATSYVNNVLVHNAVGSGFTLTTGTNETRVGSQVNTYYFNGYQAEINFVDGSVVAPSSFAETDAITGQWNPKKYVGSYGTNGFYLNFSDNSGTTATTLGKDSSGNGNNFTPNNLSVAAGEGNDSLEDTPTLNYPTLNPLDMGSTTASHLVYGNGNLQVKAASGVWASTRGTFAVSSGKWYWEVKVLSAATLRPFIGIIESKVRLASNQTEQSNELGPTSTGLAYWVGSPLVRGGTNTSGTSTNVPSCTANDIVGVALDMDNKKVFFSKNGTFFASQDPANSTGEIVSFSTTMQNATIAPAIQTYNGSSEVAMNFGQRAFDYTPPTGYKKLNSANLPDPTIKLPNKHFDTLLYTGNGGSQSITGLNFQPDWAWIKERTGASIHHSITDSVRGVLKTISSSRTDIAEKNESSGLNQLLSNGLGFNGEGFYYVNRNSEDYVAWNWNAGDTDGKTYTVKVVSDSGNKYRFDNFGTSAVTLDLAEGGTYIFDQSDSSNAGHPLRFSTTSNGTHGGGSEYTTGVTTAGTPGQAGAYTQIVVAASAPTLYYYCTQHSGMGGQANTNSTLGSSNLDGTIQSVAKVNASAGFSIIKYTGNGTGGASIGHGLGVPPKAYIIKRRDGGSGGTNWRVYHHKLNGGSNPEQYHLILNATNAESGQSNIFNDTAPTSSVFTVGTHVSVNGSSGTHVAYCFSEVAGYSKFGSYTGNGSSDGTFVFTGFRPAWILIKRTDSASEWSLFDTARKTFNVGDLRLEPNSSSAEDSNSVNYHDILSNGFKMRNSDAARNGSGATYIYLAFAESPFKNARAR